MITASCPADPTGCKCSTPSCPPKPGEATKPSKDNEWQEEPSSKETTHEGFQQPTGGVADMGWNEGIRRGSEGRVVVEQLQQVASAVSPPLKRQGA